MALRDLVAGRVYLSSGRWTRSDVRRFPKGICPRCRYTGALKRNPDSGPLDSDGWLTRRHWIPGTERRCDVVDAVVQPVEIPHGWVD